MRREGSVRVLHLRLRSAQQGFAPSPVQHNGQLCSLVAAKTSNVQRALSRARPKESRAFPLTMTYMEVGFADKWPLARGRD
jgi:hypothetical protein